MARKALIEKTFNKKPRFPGRIRNRCRLCGRARAYIRKFGLCRICFRKHALEGHVPGVKKSSW
jgi:small subunit ribosomal protein S14